MSQQSKVGLLAVIGVVGLVAASCGGSSGSPSDGGLADIIRRGMGPIVADGGDDSGEAGTSGVFDGTTGQPCKSDTDCVSPNGPGTNKCSSSLGNTITGVAITPMATPVCVATSCDSAPPGDPTGMFIHYCDGPDRPTSPGICLPDGAGSGLCLPACSFNFDGTAPSGCIGHDTCIPYGETTDQTGAVIGGIGICEGFCEKDSDCTALGATWMCQTDLGFCTQKPRARTKPLGAACSTATAAAATACNCLTATGSSTGFCTSACLVGGTVPCADGWVCDNGSASLLNDGTPLTSENPKTAGTCFPPCSLGDAGVAEAATPEASAPVDGGADGQTGAPEAGAPVSCPPSSTCQVLTPLGAECSP